jgi:ABC-type sulfate/molybdate transport systems ATPase subunit
VTSSTANCEVSGLSDQEEISGRSDDQKNNLDVADIVVVLERGAMVKIRNQLSDQPRSTASFDRLRSTNRYFDGENRFIEHDGAASATADN